ncbi:hypothetical protein A5893_07855 [Pedobacter psychrophilus]|uniref:DUF547 domain-containing protein n=1 Tax=Pedobacter psychrophilus TaxID=1826909 RepID=A0A179DIE4_9SPHI|nr:DUF547 domain-containing protein [Pedobacter psychrophilus]OAQ40837.1 hypothetical protein A5893_07855 [Pedobacter psychrophilus]
MEKIIMKKVKIIVAGLCIVAISASCTNGTTKNKDKSAASPQATTVKENLKEDIASINHSAFDKLLKKNVSDKGKVDYAAFVKDKASLEDYITLLTKINPAKLSKNEQTAYWINAYNASVIDKIVRNYPTKSILKIDGGKAFDVILPYKFNGESLSLNDIEKKKLMGSDLFDGRIHFAVNCAAVSCPTLQNQAYTASNIQSLLTLNTKAALTNPAFNKISADKASLSKLFDWYKADFIKAEGSVENFVNKYSSTKINKNTNISYMDYNWDLNSK